MASDTAGLRCPSRLAVIGPQVLTDSFVILTHTTRQATAGQSLSEVEIVRRRGLRFLRPSRYIRLPERAQICALRAV